MGPLAVGSVGEEVVGEVVWLSRYFVLSWKVEMSDCDCLRDDGVSE